MNLQLLNYRKQKIETLQKEFVVQERKYSEKFQEEVEQSEKLREAVWQLQKDVEQYKLTEEKV